MAVTPVARAVEKTERKKTDVPERLAAFEHVGLPVNEPSSFAGVPFI
jgi:hypothetical protein